MSEQALGTALKAYARDLGVELVGIVSVETLEAQPPVWVGWTIQAHTERVHDHWPEARSAVMLGYHAWDDALEVAVRRQGAWHWFSPMQPLQTTFAVNARPAWTPARSGAGADCAHRVVRWQRRSDCAKVESAGWRDERHRECC